MSEVNIPLRIVEHWAHFDVWNYKLEQVAIHEYEYLYSLGMMPEVLSLLVLLLVFHYVQFYISGQNFLL